MFIVTNNVDHNGLSFVPFNISSRNLLYNFFLQSSKVKEPKFNGLIRILYCITNLSFQSIGDEKYCNKLYQMFCNVSIIKLKNQEQSN